MLSPKLTYGKKDSFTLNLSAGVNNYHYTGTSGNDQAKLFSKIGAKKYLLEKKLMLTSSYKLETTGHKRANRQKNKFDSMLGFDYIFDVKCVYKITARAKFGQRDTKDEEERDEDFDYKYRQFHVKTEHRINPKIKTDLTYQYFKKDYLTAELGHNGFYVRNNWRYKVLSDKTQELYFNFTAKHKEVDYVFKSVSDYKKETIGITGTYKRKKNWEASASLNGSFYDYKDSTRAKDRYYSRLSFKKLFPAKNLSLSLDFKYKYTDNKQANNTEEEALRLAFKYKF